MQTHSAVVHLCVVMKTCAAQTDASAKAFWNAEAGPYLATSVHSPCLVVENAFASC